MYRVGHAGYCCGITAIFGFNAYTTPEMTAYAQHQTLKALKDNGYSERVFLDKLPQQTYGERLDALINLINPEDHIIEVVLASYQMAGWEKPLLDRGFKIVNSITNRNSSNKITVFHLTK